MTRYLIVIMITFFTFQVNAQLSVVAVGKARLEADKTYFGLNLEKVTSEANKELLREVRRLFANDFSFYRKKFEVISPSDSLDKEASSFKKSWWQSKGYSHIALIEGIEAESGLSFSVTGHVLKGDKSTFNYSVVIDRKNLRDEGHRAAGRFYEHITGEKSIFETHIIFVSDRDSTKNEVIKEIYRMDFDGNEVERLTKHKGNVISPAISYDGTKILYSLIDGGKDKKRNVNLRIFDLNSRASKLLSSRRGINSGAVFHPDGKNIILTLSYQGNAELYEMDLSTKKLRRLTNHFSPDVDPSIIRDGSLLTFLSGRPGSAMIYTMDPSGEEKSVKRISFVGQFNATPRFSPKGDQIAFSSWLDNRFDIFRINPDGSGLYRLTKDFGSNEDPTYSNDGEFIAFSSQRVISRTKAVHNIYIMDKDGEILGQVTKDFGNCITPRWSKAL